MLDVPETATTVLRNGNRRQIQDGPHEHERTAWRLHCAATALTGRGARLDSALSSRRARCSRSSAARSSRSSARHRHPCGRLILYSAPWTLRRANRTGDSLPTCSRALAIRPARKTRSATLCWRHSQRGHATEFLRTRRAGCLPPRATASRTTHAKDWCVRKARSRYKSSSTKLMN